MFKNLMNYGFQRNAMEAIGFYLAHLVLLMIVAVLSAAMLAVAMQNDAFDFGLKVGSVTAVIFCLGVSFLILKEKELLRSFGFVLLAIIAGMVTLYYGGIVGLIPVAYLTTRPISTK
jgi:hypothetical protein